MRFYSRSADVLSGVPPTTGRNALIKPGVSEFLHPPQRRWNQMCSRASGIRSDTISEPGSGWRK